MVMTDERKILLFLLLVQANQVSANANQRDVLLIGCYLDQIFYYF